VFSAFLIYVYLFSVDYGLKRIWKLSFQTVIKSTSQFKKSLIRISGYLLLIASSLNHN
jgi:hypothetical protein